MRESNNGANHWFAFSFWLVLISIILVVVVSVSLEYPPNETWFYFLNRQLWFSILDIILFFSVPYIMVPILNKKDQATDSDLMGKYTYVSFLINEKRILPILGLHILCIVLSFLIPLLVFILFIPFPFSMSIYRNIMKDKKNIPRQV